MLSRATARPRSIRSRRPRGPGPPPPGNGLEAIERSEALRPDVVLMDLAMPEMGGLQATRLIKAQDEPPFIVIASHFDDAEHREHATRAGADGFVSKLSYLQEVVPILERLAGVQAS